MSGGKPATEAQLNEVVEIVDILTEAVEHLAKAVEELLLASRGNHERLNRIEGAA